PRPGPSLVAAMPQSGAVQSSPRTALATAPRFLVPSTTDRSALSAAFREMPAHSRFAPSPRRRYYEFPPPDGSPAESDRAATQQLRDPAAAIALQSAPERAEYVVDACHPSDTHRPAVAKVAGRTTCSTRTETASARSARQRGKIAGGFAWTFGASGEHPYA